MKIFIIVLIARHSNNLEKSKHSRINGNLFFLIIIYIIIIIINKK